MHLKGIGKLIVIAQDWPAYLPVEMLLTEKPSKDDGNVTNWAWLDRKYLISYALSVTTLDILCKQRAKRKARQWQRPLFALADPPFSTEQLARMKSEKNSPVAKLLAFATSVKQSDSMLTRMFRFDAKAVPSRLPGTRREARMIAGILGAEQSLLRLGPDASERKLFEASKTGKLKQCRYIHLATHGLADSDRPEFSGLALARVPADKDYDGILHMREVFQLELDADLVVLSACQTGLGKNLGGEGVVGLSTAFFFAGTSSVVMSVWNVPDAPTALLMHRFYSNLKASNTKAAALREAKAWLRTLTRKDLKKLGQADPTVAQLTRGFQVTTAPKGHRTDAKPFAHPHYWAGFILTGDPE
jgi:CHAT domain-containing protein